MDGPYDQQFVETIARNELFENVGTTPQTSGQSPDLDVRQVANQLCANRYQTT